MTFSVPLGIKVELQQKIMYKILTGYSDVINNFNEKSVYQIEELKHYFVWKDQR